jgi:hypothetical protein
MPPSTARSLALCAALALLAALAATPASAAVVSEGCVCSDVRPRVGTGPTHVARFAPAATCLEIRSKGQCDEKWMLDTVKELEGDGYCMVSCCCVGGVGCFLFSFFGGWMEGGKSWLAADPLVRRRLHPLSLQPPSSPTPRQITCGRCKCCQPVEATLRAAGLPALVDAAAGTPYETLFTDPAFEATVLVPAAGRGAAAIKDVSLHVLPPVAKWGNATWTPELLAADPDGRLLVGAGASYVKQTLQACKATIIVTDKPASA